jgi:DNA-binding transcriptional LysR family regulator
MNSTNFHQLYIFHTVARLGSFSKAAEELEISQPAVSIQVRELEKSLGNSLLHRMRRGLQLTDTGKEVYSYTQRIFALADEMQSAVQDIQGLKSGRLTIGSSTTPGEYILPWAIGRFRQRYPGIEVSLSISNTHTIVQKILSHELDMGMAGAPVSLQGLVSFSYVSDDIVIIEPPAHPLARKRTVTLEALKGQEFIMREQGSATRRTAEQCLAQHGISIHVVMELGSNEAVKRAVAAGLGLGMVSKFAVTPDTLAGFLKVLSVEGWRCTRPLTVFYRDDKHLPSAQRAFLRFLQEDRPMPEVSTEPLPCAPLPE